MAADLALSGEQWCTVNIGSGRPSSWQNSPVQRKQMGRPPLAGRTACSAARSSSMPRGSGSSRPPSGCTLRSGRRSVDRCHRGGGRRHPADGLPPLHRRRGAVHRLYGAPRRPLPEARSGDVGDKPGPWRARPDRAHRAVRLVHGSRGGPTCRSSRDIALWPAGAIERNQQRQLALVDSIVGGASGNPPASRGGRARGGPLDLALARRRARAVDR